ncbi:SDR family oxidoreductase [Halobacillus litoralis]|uniref:SDR family oxidoreductase n=1 Tax=Halobacillus litoralis TaxID=45668 RepID=UPI001CD79061|nr:SDR family oxidoreductase [Halobacillus litoralis]MCA0969519.1 SDR family oxidoreductase [Halobacillus litoralis]
MKGTIIITGASSGFGYLTAVKCAEKGFRVIATMRDLHKASVYDTCAEVVRNNIDFWQLDVTDPVSIAAFSDRVQKLRKVDILINNAGFAIGGFVEQVSVEDYRRQFETNLFGLIGVTQVVLPKMREQASGKIINVSSISGRIGFPGLSPYVSSKYALEGWTESLRLEMKPFGVDVALIEPGSFQTNIWSTGMELSDAVTQPDSPYAFYFQKLWRTLESQSHGDPDKVAELMARLASQSSVSKLRYPVGRSAKGTLILKRLLPWRWFERLVLKNLFS